MKSRRHAEMPITSLNNGFNDNGSYKLHQWFRQCNGTDQESVFNYGYKCLRKITYNIGSRIAKARISDPTDPIHR